MVDRLVVRAYRHCEHNRVILMTTDDSLNAAELLREHKSRLMRIALSTLSCFLLVYVVAAMVAGLSWLIGAAAIAILFVGLSFRCQWTGKTGAAVALMLSACWICIVAAGSHSSGASWVAAGWLAVLVMLAGLLGGIRHCFAWAAVAALTLSANFWLYGGAPGVEQAALSCCALGVYLQGLAQLLAVAGIAAGYASFSSTLARALTAQTYVLQREVQAKQQAEGVAQAAERAKSVFLTGINHEIRTPLNSIIGFSSRLVKRKCLVDPRDQSAIQAVLHNGNVLLSLATDLLELASLEAAQLQCNAQPFSGDELLREAVATVESAAKQYGLFVHVQYSAETMLRGDQVRLHRMLASLLNFCIAHTQEGGIDLSLTPLPKDGIAGARIQMSDTSNGLAQSQLEGLADNQYQILINSNREVPISALTVALAHKVVTLHRGNFELVSETGHGVRFDIWLPLAVTGGLNA